MRKAGGIVALIGGVCCVLGGIGATLMLPTREMGFLYLVGGTIMAFFVIVPAALIVYTGGPLQPLVLIATCLIGIWFGIGGGFVTVSLVFALIGGIMALFQRD